MGKSKALETALNNKLLSSHEHLKKGIFSPPPSVEPSTHVQGQKWAENSDGGRSPNREHSLDAHEVL